VTALHCVRIALRHLPPKGRTSYLGHALTENIKAIGCGFELRPVEKNPPGDPGPGSTSGSETPSITSIVTPAWPERERQPRFGAQCLSYVLVPVSPGAVESRVALWNSPNKSPSVSRPPKPQTHRHANAVLDRDHSAAGMARLGQGRLVCRPSTPPDSFPPMEPARYSASGVGFATGGSIPKVLAVIQVIEKLPIDATSATRLSNPIVLSAAV
jgi:hypothetical protein